MALAITNENYDEIMNAGKPVIIDFWAEWCGPCRMVAPIIDELHNEYGDKVSICKCDIESADDVVAKYMVRNIPTVVFIKDGKVIEKQVGAASKEDLVKKLEKLL